VHRQQIESFKQHQEMTTMTIRKPNASLARKVSAIAFVMMLLGCVGMIDTAPVTAAPKVIDWDKKLAKPRQLMETNNVEEAIKIYEDLLKKHADSAAVHTELGKCYKRRGKLSMAKAEFKRATEVESTYADAWYELGAMYQSDKEYDLAAQAFSRFIQMAPYSEKKDAVLDRIKFCKSQL
jgi:tetratricopeptide (TPR) repeat protein